MEKICSFSQRRQSSLLPSYSGQLLLAVGGFSAQSFAPPQPRAILPGRSPLGRRLELVSCLSLGGLLVQERKRIEETS